MKLKLLAMAALLAACETPAADETGLEVSETAPEAPTEVMELAGSEWEPVGSITSPGELYVQFDGEGRIRAYAGCNSLSGDYTQTDNAIEVGPIMSTRMMCGPEIMAAERALSNVLREARTVEASHLELRLFDENGELLTDMKRRDWD